MNRFRTMKWASLMMAMALVAFSCGSDDDDNKPVIKGDAPDAGFTSGTDANDYLKINFTNTSEGATSYEWDFGDGSAVSTEENPSHTYEEVGDYEITLTAKNEAGEDQATETRTVKVQLTLPALIGSGAKSWVIKPAAGAFGVGPDIGSDVWFPNGADISGDRPCLFNDEFIFKSDDEFEYDANDDIWAEAYMGYGDSDKDKCQDESTLPESSAAWGSGVHSFEFNPETDGSTPTITVTGTGAFIALPKAKNGSEYAAGPPETDGSVTYDVVSYTNDGGEELAITINYGGGYWNFILVPKPE